MAKFRVSYRGEFEKTIEAETLEEAVSNFTNGSKNYQLVGELHDDFIEVFDKNGNEIYQE